MKRLLFALSTLALLGTVIPEPAHSVLTVTAQSVELTDDVVADIIVQDSRDRYHETRGPCACPYDTARNGRVCGERSARSRPDGAPPLCYRKDVTPEMIERHR
jgi:hypothetical protein